MAKQFFIRETPLDKVLDHIQSLEKKIDVLASQVNAGTKKGMTAVYSTPTVVETNVLSVAPSVEEEAAPLYIPKARLGEASIKKVKTTLEAHDSEDVEKLKKKRKTS